ncbi:MAG: hypothetical protein OJF51_002471 [Nitrospira sp.]|nr:MAG: hypothetical protein OJF51_002471 [Nitrospira sp.]
MTHSFARRNLTSSSPPENRGRKSFGGRVLSHSNHDEEEMREMILNEQTSTTRLMRRVHQGEEAET